MPKHRVLGINFDHMHMGDLLREVSEHPDAEIAGVFDSELARMESAITTFAVPDAHVFTDLETGVRSSDADVAIICSATAEHADYVEKTLGRFAPVLDLAYISNGPLWLKWALGRSRQYSASGV